MSNTILDTPGTLRPLLRLALPVLIEQIFLSMVWFSDRVLTGHYLETPHLAAITLMAYVLWLLTGLFSVVAVAATAMVARFVGANDPITACRVTNQSMVLGVVMACVATAGGYWGGEPVVRWMQLEGESAQLAVSYLRIVVPALPLVMLQVVGIACLRGAGDMVSGLVIMVIVNVVNVTVSWVLVLGLGPFPELGWQGVAMGTMAGFVVGGTLVSGLLMRGRVGLQILRRHLRPNPDLIRRLMKIGIPAGVDTLSLIACQLWFLSVINRLGDLSAAAHGTAICAESLAFLPGSAFQVASATLVGQYLGARDFDRATRSVIMACLVGGGVMVTAGICFFTFADQLPRLLVGEEQLNVARLATPLLRLISTAIPALALVMILNGALRGAGDTRWPMVVSLVGLLGIRIPLAYWLAFSNLRILGLEIEGWGLGVLGAWYALVIDLWVRAALIFYRFQHGGWKRIQV